MLQAVADNFHAHCSRRPKNYLTSTVITPFWASSYGRSQHQTLLEYLGIGYKCSCMMKLLLSPRLPPPLEESEDGGANRVRKARGDVFRPSLQTAIFPKNTKKSRTPHQPFEAERYILPLKKGKSDVKMYSSLFFTIRSGAVRFRVRCGSPCPPRCIASGNRGPAPQPLSWAALWPTVWRWHWRVCTPCHGGLG